MVKDENEVNPALTLHVLKHSWPFPASSFAATSPQVAGTQAFNRQRWHSRRQQIDIFLKRMVDIVLASAGLILLLPVFAVIALLIYGQSPGPVFYRSLRLGKNNQPFYMLKFRSMVVGADRHRDQLRKEARLEGQLFKLVDDPRVTRVGGFLRRYSLDELPQLLNVLQGSMSMVGPRPLPPEESILFTEPYLARFNVQPGVTGLWQVSGRSNLNFEQLCQLELSYITNWHLLRDLSILFKTIPAVLLKKGAC